MDAVKQPVFSFGWISSLLKPGRSTSASWRSFVFFTWIFIMPLYSYFSSKEALLTQAMVEEWRSLIREIREKLPAMETVEIKLKYLYESIFNFNGRYHGFCARTQHSEKDRQECERRRTVQLEQVGGIVALILPEVQNTEGLAAFIADLFLSNCNRGVFPYEKNAPFVRKLYA